MEIPSQWEECIIQLLNKSCRPHIVFAIGAPDVGKTTFCCALANAAIEHGLTTMIVDADMGQSDIGPPTTIGLGRVCKRIEHLNEAEYVAGFFVGHTSPMGYLLPTVIGTKLMTDKAISSGADIVIIDTTGLVRGSIGRELKWRKVQLIRPQSLVAIQQNTELAHLLAVFRGLKWLQVYSISFSQAVRQRDREIRRLYREQRFKQFLEGAKEVEISLNDVALLNTHLGSGTPVHPSFIAHLSELAGAEILHAERCGDVGVIITAESVEEGALRWMSSRWGVNEVITLPVERLYGLVLGLHDSDGEFLCIGVLIAYDSFSKRLRILMPPGIDLKEVAFIVFGRTRIHPDGSEIGSLAPQSL